MEIPIEQAVMLLEKTPSTLRALLSGLPDSWIRANEGGESWSPYDVLGHLVHGENTDWIPRAKRLLEHGESKPFDRFDRFAQFQESKGKSLPDLLDEFEASRRRSLAALRGLALKPADLGKRGNHPSFGTVTLKQLLSTWVAHDLGHLAQIARVMAKQLSLQVGPWEAYLPILHDRKSGA